MHTHAIHSRFFVIAILVVAISAAGCAARYGTLERSIAVDRAFNRYEVRYDHRYYYTGGENKPVAILAVQEAYTLDTTVWIAMEDLTPDLMKRRVEAMSAQLGFSPGNFGGKILDPDGKAVGLWFSPLTGITIRFEDDNVISVSLPRDREFDGPGFRRRFRD